MRLLLVGILIAGAILRVWYAAYGLDENRFWDERYNFENVESILETGSLRPAKVYYPSPLQSWPQVGLLAASAALHRATGSAVFAIRDADGFTPTAYLLCRLLSVVFGVAALGLLFVVARAMAGPQVALLATLVLAFLPWHIHASGKFKPDALVVLTVLLAFHWSLKALREPSARAFALAGIGIALAVSGKVTGGVIAVSLVTGVLLAGELTWLRRLKLLAVAGVVSLAAFLAMNPYGRWYLDFVSGLQRDYEMRAGWTESSGFIPLETLRYLLGGFVHGPLVGVLVLAAAIVLAVRIATGRAGDRERVDWSMLLAFPIVFTAAYTIATPYFKGNNFLPILPFTCILAAWAGWEGWRFARSRLVGPARSALSGSLSAVALALVVVPGLLYVYRSLVPSAIDIARQALASERRSPAGRFYYIESVDAGEPTWEGREAIVLQQLGFRSAAALHEVGAERLDRADGEIFPAARLEGAAGDFYRRRLERVDASQRQWVLPRLFEVRGAAAVAVAHRWTPGPPVELVFTGRCRQGRNCFGFEIRESPGPARLVSLRVTVPTAAVDPDQTTLGISVDGAELDTVRVGIRGLERSFLTERFHPSGPELELHLTDVEPRLLRRQVGVELHAWTEDGQ